MPCVQRARLLWCVVFLVTFDQVSHRLNLQTQAAFAEGGIVREFHVGKEVAVLGVSLYVFGLGKNAFLSHAKVEY